MIDQEQGLANYLARLVCRIGSASLSEKDCTIVRQHLLDAIASAYIGCRSEVFEKLIHLSPQVREGCAFPGKGAGRISLPDGAMVWAFAVNASVFEDGSREGACHPAAAVLPVIIALSDEASWEKIDRSAVAGYDVMVRLCRGGNPEFVVKGFHPTSITAPFGAAATASVLLGHDLPTTRNALCLAAMGSAGLMSAFKSGRTQPLQVAWAVRCGITAAIMAGAGQTGYSRIIEEGFYRAYLGHDPDPPLDDRLENEYAITGSYLKPYPGCRHLHPSIDAFGNILRENGLNPDDIEQIRVGTYRTAVETEIHDLKSRGDAYFNIPYALAARALLGKNDYDAFDEKHFTNERIVGFMQKIRVDIDAGVDSLYPGQRGAVVEVTTTDGRTLVEKVNHPLGEPENPLPLAVTLEKFRTAAGDFLSRETLKRVEGILGIPSPPEPPGRLFECLGENNQAL